MASFTLKGLPEPMLARLKAQAERHRRSINSEMLVCLELALNSAPPDGAGMLARIDALHARLGRRPRLTEAMLREAKKGRP